MKTKSVPDNLLFPRFKRAFVVTKYRGQVHVQAWPRKRGKPTNPVVIQNNKDFAAAARLAKYADATTIEIATRITKNSGLYPRDLMFAAMLKGFVTFKLLDGRTIRPWSRLVEEINVQSTRVTKTTAQALLINAVVAITFQAPVIDDLGFYSAAFPTRLTVPVNVSRVEIVAGLITLTASPYVMGIQIRKNGVTVLAQNRAYNGIAASFDINIALGPTLVIAGDYFEVLAFASKAWTVAADIRSFVSLNILKAP